MDDDDQLTRQRAMDAAAAVAVAAAAAAHQSQEAALQLHHQQHREQQEESHLEEEEEKQSHGDLILNGENDAHRSSSIQIGEEKPDLLNEDEKIGTFADNSMQYVASDYTDQNGDLSRQIDDSQTGAGRPTIHHTKRRKINTCLPCKRRKVKCDRERPYCGQCKKHNFPASECTWSLAIESSTSVKAAPEGSTSSSIPASTAVADAAVAAVVNSASASAASGSHWYEMNNAPWANFTPISVEQNSQSLLSRVAELEAALAATRNEQSNGFSRTNQTQWDGKESGLSEAERGLAADALAMIAQHDPQANAVPISQSLGTSQPFAYKAKRLFSFAKSSTPPSEVFPYYKKATSIDQIRDILALLPELAIIKQLLRDFDEMQEYGMDVGIMTDVVKYQLETVQIIVERGKGEESEGLDLSFMALLFLIIAFSLEMKSTSAALDLDLMDKQTTFKGLTEGQRVDAVQKVSASWFAAGQILLEIVEYESNPNLNILYALSVKHHYLGVCGSKSVAARNTLTIALSLCDILGIANLEFDKNGETDLLEFYVSFLLPNLGKESQAQVEKDKIKSLLQESVQRLYCNFVAYHCLEGGYNLSIRTNFHCQAARYAGKYGMTKGLFELASKVVEQKEEHLQHIRNKQIEHEAETGIGENWYDPSPIVREAGQEHMSTEMMVERYGVFLSSQCQLLKIYTRHQVMKARGAQLQEEDVESAYHILHSRGWFDDQGITTFDFSKVIALKQMTLEAIFTIAIYSSETRLDLKSRADFDKGIYSLSPYKVGQSQAQKLIQVLVAYLDSKKNQFEVKGEDQAKIQRDIISSLSESLAQSVGLKASHDLCAYLGKICSRSRLSNQEKTQFWRTISIHGAHLMESSFEVSI